MIVRVIGIGLTALAMAPLVYVYLNLNTRPIRRGLNDLGLWEFRYILLLIAAFGALSFAQWLAGKLNRDP